MTLSAYFWLRLRWDVVTRKLGADWEYSLEALLHLDHEIPHLLAILSHRGAGH